MKHGLMSSHDPIAGVPNQDVRSAFELKNSPTIKDVARLCHELHRLWSQFLGDDKQPAWDDLPAWVQQVNISGVHYHLYNVATTPRDSHMVWLEQMQKDGWKWGKVKDPEKKEHPCMCSYDNLPWYKQAVDNLFYFVVYALKPILQFNTTRTLTEGERIAGVQFNPSHDWRIDLVKGLYAELYHFIERFEKEQAADPNVDDDFARKQVHRSAAEAKTCLQTSKMYCVEAMTR